MGSDGSEGLAKQTGENKMSDTSSARELAALEDTVARVTRDLNAAVQHAALTEAGADYELVAHTIAVCETVTQDLRRTLAARGFADSATGTNES